MATRRRTPPGKRPPSAEHGSNCAPPAAAAAGAFQRPVVPSAERSRGAGCTADRMFGCTQSHQTQARTDVGCSTRRQDRAKVVSRCPGMAGDRFSQTASVLPARAPPCIIVYGNGSEREGKLMRARPHRPSHTCTCFKICLIIGVVLVCGIVVLLAVSFVGAKTQLSSRILLSKWGTRAALPCRLSISTRSGLHEAHIHRDCFVCRHRWQPAAKITRAKRLRLVDADQCNVYIPAIDVGAVPGLWQPGREPRPDLLLWGMAPSAKLSGPKPRLSASVSTLQGCCLATDAHCRGLYLRG